MLTQISIHDTRVIVSYRYATLKGMLLNSKMYHYYLQNMLLLPTEHVIIVLMTGCVAL